MSIGSILRERRVTLGHDLPSMAQYLRIRLPYLEAIENDDFKELPPGNAYGIGFIKSYATALDLDPDEMVALFRSEQNGTQKTPLRVRTPLKETRSSTFSLIGILVIMVAAGWIGWAYIHHSDRHLADEVAPVPDRLQPKTAEATPSPAAAASAESGEPDEARDETYNHASATQPAAAASHPQPASIAPATPATGHVLNEITAVSRVSIAAVGDTWMQIKNNGDTIYTGIMHPGDIYTIPDQNGWTMTAGNAGGVTLTLDGKPGQPLGPAGAVIREVPLDSAVIAANHP